MNSQNTPVPRNRGALIEWRKKSTYTQLGFLIGHPETTLFTMTGGENVILKGAFLPDAEDGKLHTRADAEKLAEKATQNWIALAAQIKGRVIVGSIPVKELPQ